ncbi:amino acid permease 8-like, partial [Carica papaya]|uniref:amino acid permease 8-like n=1 Tax=Carica papaya TaxID=3649 RepID=UPI000B8CFF62
LGLSIAKIAEGKPVKSSITGTVVGVDVTKAEKIWNLLQALGNIAFAYSFSVILIEIQDTLKSKPAENKVMRKISTISVSVTTMFYMLCGILGYAAFGNESPGNFLTGFGFYEPFWLLDFANMCVVVHLVGAYQVFSQPVYRLVENWCSKLRPDSNLITKGYSVNIPGFGNQNVNMFRLFWRTGYVIFTALMAMIFPFFNNVLGLIGAFTFWPLTVYFPIKMHFSQAKVQKYSTHWIALTVLSTICFLISALAFVASIEGLIVGLHSYKPFSSIS